VVCLLLASLPICSILPVAVRQMALVTALR